MVTTHPTDVELHDFLVGNLPEGRFAAIESHLSNCDDCVERAAGAQASDTLVKLLAAAGTQLVAQRSVAATPVPLDTQPGLRGTLAGNPEALSSPAFTAPPAIANHPRYKLLRWLGAGGMGSVWQAEHLVLQRLVAIKVIRPEFLAKVGAAERFRREARAVAKLSHPNIVAAFDAEEVAGTHFLVMEYVAGENLGDVLDRGALPVAEACQIVRDAARGLAHAHSHDLVHRDIKPHNLIRAADGTTKILDFGLATAEAGSREGLTGEDMVLGTPDYIAPEQAQDARSAEASSDVYSLGCTLFALLAGQAPFAGGTALSKIDAHRHSPIPPLPQAPAELAAIVARMLAKKPSERPTASAVAEALEPFCAGARGPVAIIATQPSPRRLSPGILALSMLLLLGGLISAGVIYKVQTDKQEIEIETNDPDIQVVMRRNGQLVRIKDTKTKQSWNLDAEKLQLRPDGSELAIDLPGKEPLVIRRAGENSITIRWRPLVPKPALAAAASPPASERIEPFRVLEGHTARTRQAIFSADGKTIYSAGDDGFIRIWDATAGRQTGQLEHGAGVVSLALAEDGKSLLSITVPLLEGPGPTRLWIWDLAAGKVGDPFPAIAGERLNHVAVSSNGKRAATLATSGQVCVWSIAERKLLHSWNVLESSATYHITWSPDDEQLAVSGDGLSIWNVETGKLVQRLPPFPTGQISSRFTPDGKQIITGGWDGMVRVYERGNWKLLQEFQASKFKGPVPKFGITPDSRFWVGGSLSEATVWDLVERRQVAVLDGHQLALNGVYVSADGEWAASANEDKTVRLWRLPKRPPADSPAANTMSDQPIKPYRTFEGHARRTRHAIFIPDGKTVYSGGDDGFVRTWDVESGHEAAEFTNGDLVINLVLINKGRGLLVSTPGQIKVWDLVTGKEQADAPQLPAGEQLTRLAVSPDGRKVAGGANSGTVRIWDLASRKLEREWPAVPALPTYSVAWSTDGKQVVAGMDQTLTLFDYASDKHVHRIYKLRTIIGSAVTPDGLHMIVVTWDGVVEIYDRLTGRVVKEFNAGMIDSMKACHISVLSNQRLVTSGRGHFIDVWDWPSATRLATFSGHTGQVLSVSVSADHKLLVSCGEDSTVRVWQLPEGLR